MLHIQSLWLENTDLSCQDSVYRIDLYIAIQITWYLQACFEKKNTKKGHIVSAGDHINGS